MNGINIITANFSNGGRQCVTRKLFQYDYGQKVQIKGLNLPQSFQVHISNTNNPLSSSSIFLGRNNEIEIPDEFLISGEGIYIWIFLHQTTSDGETRYTINIPVQKRPKIENKQPTPVEKNVVDQLISSLEEKIDEMSDATEEAKDTFLKYPKIIDDYWYVYDIKTKTWINSEVKALGENGVGIKEINFNDDYSLTIIFTDNSEFNTPSIRGEKGDKGNTPVITAQRSNHTITIYADGIKIAELTDGEDGSTPVITAERLGTNVIIYVNGTIIATLHDGKKGDDYILTEADKQEIANIVDVPVTDVQINGTSIVENKVANIPVASANALGLVKVTGNGGIRVLADGQIGVSPASVADIKEGATSTGSIVPSRQHASAFYGLAKAAGDTTQAMSANTVGTYTDQAKTAIQTMLGIDTAIADAVGEITSFDFQVVTALPSTGTKGVIYLVAHSHGSNDGYDEYIWINNAFEKLGHTDIDLTGYLQDNDISTDAQVNAMLQEIGIVE